MNVSLTGASGFIGQTFLERLRASGLPDDGPARIRLLASSERSAAHLRSKWPMFEVAELYDGRGGINAGAMVDTDRLLHFGWSTVPGTAKSDPVADLRVNVEQGIMLLSAAVANGVGRVIFISSGGTVYGEPHYLPVDERHPVQPRTPYGASKLLFEHYLRCMADLHGLDQIVVRPANVYGRVDGPSKPQGVVEHWLASIAVGRPVQVWNGMDVIRDYVHVDDLAGLLLILLHYEGKERIFNVGTGIGTSLRDLAAMMERITGRSILIDQAGSTPPDVSANILDPALLLSELGVRPVIGLEEGIARTWSGMHRPR